MSDCAHAFFCSSSYAHRLRVDSYAFDSVPWLTDHTFMHSVQELRVVQCHNRNLTVRMRLRALSHLATTASHHWRRHARCCDAPVLFARSSVARQLVDLDQQSHTVRPLLSSRVNSNSSLSLALQTSVSRVRHLSACLICVTSTSCSLTAAARTSSTTTPMPTFSQIGCADSPQSALSESESRSRTWPQLTKLATDWGDFGPAFDDELASETDESASY